MTEPRTSKTDTTTKGEQIIQIYYNPKPTIKICIKFLKEEVALLTLSQLVARAIKILGQDYNLQTNLMKSDYCVYPASKTGTKKDGYPELDSKLLVSKIPMRKLFLQERSKAYSFISTEFNLQKKYGFQKPVKNEASCCSLLTLLKA